MVTASKRDEARVPFGNLIESGLIEPGELLFDENRRYAARVRADGSLISDLARGSIHQVAAAVQHLPACNGWTFWCVVRQGKPVSIDQLRQQARAAMAG
jgi:modification methylase